MLPASPSRAFADAIRNAALSTILMVMWVKSETTNGTTFTALFIRALCEIRGCHTERSFVSSYNGHIGEKPDEFGARNEGGERFQGHPRFCTYQYIVYQMIGPSSHILEWEHKT